MKWKKNDVQPLTNTIIFSDELILILDSGIMPLPVAHTKMQMSHVSVSSSKINQAIWYDLIHRVILIHSRTLEFRISNNPGTHNNPC